MKSKIKLKKMKLRDMLNKFNDNMKNDMNN